MSDSHWEKVKDIFHAALEKPSGAEREQYLREACADDADLRAEVDALLDSFDDAEDFLDESPIGEVAETIIGKRESLHAGQQIGRYRIERKLGAGGAGEVFLALDVELERFVALKILSAEFSGNPDHIRRFAQEARAASALNHPNILTIYESGQIENLRFIAAEYVEGETLRERLRCATLSSDEIFDVFAQTAAALAAAHRAGIVHRDIKPENIMLRADGLVKVLDFGLAKLLSRRGEGEKGRRGENEPVSSSPLLPFSSSTFLTTPGIVMGTVAYMSPEQARGLPTDERTDVWSLGVCLSETVFGVQPFAGETISDQIAAILKSEPEPQAENAPPELRRIIEKSLEKKIENRYQTISDFLLDVKNFYQESDFSNGQGISFAATKTISTNGKQIGRNVFVPPTASSAEYVVGEIKKHKSLSLATAFLAVAALGLILYFSVFSSFFPRSKPSDAEAQNSNPSVTSNGQAHQLYLNGVFYRRQNGPENVKKAIEYQNQAIALDPNFALAYAELGFNYYNLAAAGAVDAQTGLSPARQAIEKALSLNETLAEAHDLNASLKAAEFDWTGAEMESRRAIELNPNLASAHTYYAGLLAILDRFDEALNEIRRARELDPLRINLVNNEAEILFHARRYDDAQRTYESGDPEAVNETFALLTRARVKAAKNLYPEAIALLRKSLEKDITTKGLIHLGRLSALTGERGQALAILERLKKIDLYVSPAELAILYAALGMPELAFESLERAFAERDFLLPLINIEPEYDALRDDPRFSNLLRRINLSQ